MRAAEVRTTMADARRLRIIWFRATEAYQAEGMPFIGPIRFDAFLDLWQFVHEVCDCQSGEIRWADFIEASIYTERAAQYREIDPMWIGGDDDVVH